MHGSMNTKFTFTVLCNLLHSVDVTIILVSSAYNMLCESLSVILRDYLYIYIEQHWARTGQNLEELHALLNPNLTESRALLCSLRILTVFYHVSKT